jgi:putative phosphoribosyl transferase
MHRERSPLPVARPVEISLGVDRLVGDLTVPARPAGLVLFAHGSGSGRFSPRNRWVAERLHEARLGTLLLDLLTEREEAVDVLTREYRFDIPLLAKRLVAATDWTSRDPRLKDLPLGYFGASTGAAAALIAAAERPQQVRAVVSRGGRPDLAGEALRNVHAPTLLIVGGDDEVVIRLNEDALGHLSCRKRLEIVPGATHLFEEAGKLEVVADLARDWFSACLEDHR